VATLRRSSNPSRAPPSPLVISTEPARAPALAGLQLLPPRAQAPPWVHPRPPLCHQTRSFTFPFHPPFEPPFDAPLGRALSPPALGLKILQIEQLHALNALHAGRICGGIRLVLPCALVLSRPALGALVTMDASVPFGTPAYAPRLPGRGSG